MLPVVIKSSILLLTEILLLQEKNVQKSSKIVKYFVED